MSSDFNHITRDNYEEFFLLYVDNELTPEQKAAVDAFLTLHPDLQAELELLQSTVLPMETFSFNKEELFSDKMSVSSIDEQLLLYIDNELSIEERSKVALEIEENKTKAAQYALLLQTKLDSHELVPYPNKEELYRHTKRRIVLVEWLQIAAAVIVLFLGGWLWLQPEKASTKPIVALGMPTSQQPTQPVASKSSDTEKNIRVTTASTKEPTITAYTSGKNNQANLTVLPKDKIIAKTAKPDGTEKANANSGDQTQLPIVTDRTHAVDALVTANGANNANLSGINNLDVTSTSAVRNTNITDNEPVTEESSKGRSPLKGFLRKATRFIERTTGIPATNENNEVLIASVAVRLD